MVHPTESSPLNREKQVESWLSLWLCYERTIMQEMDEKYDPQKDNSKWALVMPGTCNLNCVLLNPISIRKIFCGKVMTTGTLAN